MTRRFVGGLVAATFAIGILTGAAGAIVIGAATTPNDDLAAVMAAHMDSASSTSMMAGGMMAGPMGAGPGMMAGPAASAMPGGLHDQHHPVVSPDGAK